MSNSVKASVSKRMSSSSQTVISLRKRRFSPGMLAIKSQRAFSGEAMRKEVSSSITLRMPMEKTVGSVWIYSKVANELVKVRLCFIVMEQMQ